MIKNGVPDRVPGTPDSGSRGPKNGVRFLFGKSRVDFEKNGSGKWVGNAKVGVGNAKVGVGNAKLEYKKCLKVLSGEKKCFVEEKKCFARRKNCFVEEKKCFARRKKRFAREKTCYENVKSVLVGEENSLLEHESWMFASKLDLVSMVYNPKVSVLQPNSCHFPRRIEQLSSKLTPLSMGFL